MEVSALHSSFGCFAGLGAMSNLPPSYAATITCACTAARTPHGPPSICTRPNSKPGVLLKKKPCCHDGGGPRAPAHKSSLRSRTWSGERLVPLKPAARRRLEVRGAGNGEDPRSASRSSTSSIIIIPSSCLGAWPCWTMLRGPLAPLLPSLSSRTPSSSEAPKPALGFPIVGGSDGYPLLPGPGACTAGARAAVRALLLGTAISGTDSSACVSTSHPLVFGSAFFFSIGELSPCSCTFSSWFSTHISSVGGRDTSGLLFFSLSANRSRPRVFRRTLRLLMLLAWRGRSSSKVCSVRLHPSLCRYSRSRPSATSPRNASSMRLILEQCTETPLP
mmetsp:Transcript_36764/g.103728  ORF Transcript_36764/g.103728 Transcript_36764/m.103728 type:complete len:333 (+) Transcript_36764:1011-2009(+)